MKLVELYLLLTKIYRYEPEIFFQIRDLVGLPKFAIGDLFTFNSSQSKIIYQVFRIDKICSDRILYSHPQQMVHYKYLYQDYNIFQSYRQAHFIHDFFIDCGYVQKLES